jgi:hypothetical protein
MGAFRDVGPFWACIVFVGMRAFIEFCTGRLAHLYPRLHLRQEATHLKATNNPKSMLPQGTDCIEEVVYSLLIYRPRPSRFVRISWRIVVSRPLGRSISRSGFGVSPGLQEIGTDAQASTPLLVAFFVENYH